MFSSLVSQLNFGPVNFRGAQRYGEGGRAHKRDAADPRGVRRHLRPSLQAASEVHQNGATGDIGQLCSEENASVGRARLYRMSYLTCESFSGLCHQNVHYAFDSRVHSLRQTSKSKVPLLIKPPKSLLTMMHCCLSGS